MSVLVQIFEIQTPEEALALARLGVDHIGVLVGDGRFPRELPPVRAKEIFAAVPSGAALYLASRRNRSPAHQREVLGRRALGEWALPRPMRPFDSCSSRSTFAPGTFLTRVR